MAARPGRARLTVKSSAVYETLSIRLRYDPEGWAVYTIDEILGALSVQSDWGDYSYAWGHGGRGGKTLREFLATCSEGYIASKLLIGKKQIVHAEKTRKEMKKHVRALFKEGRLRIAIDDYYAESEFDLMRSLMSEIGEFYSQIRDLEEGTYLDPIAGELMLKVFDPLYEHIVHVMAPWHQCLYYELIPTFQAYLRGEIDGHRPPAPVQPGGAPLGASG